MKTTLKRLLSNLHRAVFDTSAEEVRLFAISRKTSDLRLNVAEEKLIINLLPGGTYDYTYDLTALTVEQLAAQLALDGFDIFNLQTDSKSLSARIMLEGSTLVQKATPSWVMGFADELHVIMGAYATMIRDARAAVTQALRQMIITQAEGSWLAYWGKLFGITRPDGMSDKDYQALIPKEAFRIRVNAIAIENTIKELTGYDVTIEEPWNDIFRLDYGRFDSASRFYDKDSIGYFLIKPVSYQTIPPLDWTEKIIPIIQRNKAAGVDIMTPEPRMRYYVNDPLVGEIWTSIWDMRIAFIAFNEYYRLDDMRFDTPVELAMHYKAAITSMQSMLTPKERLLGRVWGKDSHLLSYTADAHVVAAWMGGLGASDVKFAQAYPEALKTWRDAGTWRGFQTWSKPYEWMVFSNHYKEENKFFLNASGMFTGAKVYATKISGATWEDPDNWDTSNDWLYGSDPTDPTNPTP